MAKKGSLKATLSSQQARLKKKAQAKESSQKDQKQSVIDSAKGRTKAKAASASKATGKKRSTIPFRPSDTILLIGEGNFSFARALLLCSTLQYLPPKNITATAYDSEDECLAKYPEAHAIVKELRLKGVEVLFGIDATALEKHKLLKGRKWDRIVWNFPHAGKSITDQDRNILCNQMLLLDFLRSAAPFLALGAVPSIAVPRKKKKKNADDSGSEDGRAVDDARDVVSEDEGDEEPLNESPTQTMRDGARGTILVTLRNVPPYTEWNLPKLAKNPPPPSTPSGKPNPRYTQLRSFAFHRSEWTGYEHRMTKGERAHGTGKTGQGGEDRMWEFCLKDSE
ncbi:hypothetical protein M0805_000210 [Coniferiporia weirii]|nr:hypothetical protein M0805_000210 [Coniferiporia weirii]